MIKSKHAIWRLGLALVLVLSLGLVFAAPAAAAVTVTSATGGTAISADTFGTGAWTALTGPVITEAAAGEIGAGTIIITAPPGFEFNTDQAVTATIDDGNIDFAAGLATPLAFTITFTVDTVSTTASTITFSDIQVRPTGGTVTTGELDISGTANVADATAGTLATVAGAADHYGVSAIADQVAYTPFSVTITVQDQYNNVVGAGAETVDITFGTADVGATPTSVVTVAGTVTYEQTLTVDGAGQTITYTGATSGLTGTSAAFDVAADSTIPVLQSATVEDAAPADIVLTYNEALDEASVPAVGDFTIGGDDADGRTVTAVDVSGTTVTLTMSSAIINGDVITLTYVVGANPIQDVTGNDAAALAGQAITNSVTADAAIDPETAFFDFGTPADLAIDITWNGASSITKINDGDADLTVDDDYSVAANVLTIESAYLVTKLDAAGETLTLTIDFDAGADASIVITAVDNQPVVNPAAANFNVLGNAGLETVITWGDATGVTGITCAHDGGAAGAMNEGADYTITDIDGDTATLGIPFAYMWALSPEAADITVFTISFDLGADATFTVTAVATAPPAGGGAPAGGAASPEPTVPEAVETVGLTGDAPVVDNQGKVNAAVQVKTAAEEATLTINAGTTMLDADGAPLASLTATAVTAPPAPAPSGSIALMYDFGPDGSTFDPAIQLTMEFDPASLPAGAAAGDVTIAYYDESTGSWVEIPGVVDLKAGTVTASVTHFTTFGVIMKEPAAVPTTSAPTQTSQPTQTSSAPTETIQPGPTTLTSTVGVIGGTTTDDEKSGFPVWAIIIIGVVVAAAMVFVVRYGWNMRHD